jgi:hypothetical protein
MRRGSIFVSLTNDDTAIADALREAVKRLVGDVVRLTYSTSLEHDGGIPHGEEWFRWISQQVRACDFALVLLTPRSVHKPWVLWEAGAVYGAALADQSSMRKVRPLTFGGTAAHLPGPFAQMQILRGDHGTDVGKLFEDVVRQYTARLETAQVMAAGKKLTGAVNAYLRRLAVAEKQLAVVGDASPETALPHLSKVLADLVSLTHTQPALAKHLQIMAAELLTAMFVSVRTDNLGVNEDLTERVVRGYLDGAVSISVYETTGPASWVDPKIYRYLAPQIRQYLWRNIDATEGRTKALPPRPVPAHPVAALADLRAQTWRSLKRGRWNLVVASWLGAAMRTAIRNARLRLGSESLTVFDNPSEFHWRVGQPRLQYSRVLFWTLNELEHPIADSVIAIHEAFNIPLFFVEAAKPHDKDFAYLVFEKKSRAVTGLYGQRKNEYHTQPFDNRIPGLGDALESYKKLLGRKDLMFAVDARAWRRSRGRDAHPKPSSRRTQPA